MLALSKVDASINNIPILRDISFTVGPAETVALVGRNGAGKTTLLRTIMGFTTCHGEMRFEGADLRAVDPHRRPGLGIGYAPEDRRLFSRFTITQNILLPAQVAKLGEAETASRLERVYHVLPELRDLGPRPAGLPDQARQRHVDLVLDHRRRGGGRAAHRPAAVEHQHLAARPAQRLGHQRAADPGPDHHRIPARPRRHRPGRRGDPRGVQPEAVAGSQVVLAGLGILGHHILTRVAPAESHAASGGSRDPR